MGNIFDVPVNEFILKLAEELKSIEAVRPLEWAQFCKTGMHRERPPVQTDWWHIRAASILRFVKKTGPVGTQKLRIRYGGKKNRGYKPEHFYRGSGSIIRKILQQLEKAGLLKKDAKNAHKGRVVTPAGDKLMNKVAIAMMKEMNIVIPKRPDIELSVTNVVKKKKKKRTRKRKKSTKKKTVKKKAKKAVKKESAENQSAQATPVEKKPVLEAKQVSPPEKEPVKEEASRE